MATVKTCIDCLNCKVSAKSTENQRVCFCAEKKKKTLHKESYWLAKKTCDEFEDMGARVIPMIIVPAVVIPKRRPLRLKNGFHAIF